MSGTVDQRRLREGGEADKAGVSSLLQRALQGHKAGSVDAAMQDYRAALRLAPGNPEVHRLIGLCHLQRRELREAVAALDHAVSLAPSSAIAISNLATACFDAGQRRHAVHLYEAALALSPGLGATEAALQRARQALRPVSLDRAVERSEAERIHGSALPDAEKRQRLLQLVEQGATLPQTYNFVGVLFAQENRTAEACTYFKVALRRDPRHAPSWTNWIRALDDNGQVDRALAICDEAIDTLGAEDRLLWMRAELLGRANRFEEACNAMAERAEHGDRADRRLIQLGNVQKTLGRISEAEASYRQAAAGEESFAEAWWSLSNLKTIRFSDGDIAEMQSLSERPGLKDTQRIQLRFALAKAHADSGRHDLAFSCWEDGNRIRRTTTDPAARLSWEAKEHEAFTDKVIDAFSAGVTEKLRSIGHPNGAPIFVVSLPRSGSTLVDQILSAHSNVTGTAELGFMRKLFSRAGERYGGLQPFLDALPAIEAGEWCSIGEEYLRSVEMAYRISTPRFTDKMPNNFEIVGFILTALPNATVVNCRRNPLDTCLANYMQLFAKGQEFSYDLHDLARYYADYSRLMAHWRLLYPERIVEVEYERLIEDQEGETRRLLAGCGLPFEQACLAYHQSERPVPTASAAQVRQPIFTSGLRRWEKYADHLRPLQAELERLGVAWQ